MTGILRGKVSVARVRAYAYNRYVWGEEDGTACEQEVSHQFCERRVSRRYSHNLRGEFTVFELTY